MATTKLVIFPFFILIALTLFTVGSVLGAGQTYCINNPNLGVTCTVGSTGSVTVTCASTATSDCDVTSFFNPSVGFAGSPFCKAGTLPLFNSPPAPFYCQTTLGFDTGKILLPIGQTATISAADAASASANLGFVTFVISDIGTGGFVIALLTVMGLVVLASLQVVSSGMNTMGTRILFIGGVLVGLWFVLAAMEGYGSGNDFFGHINNDFGFVGLNQVGTALFVILTLVETAGIVGTVGGLNE